MPSAICLALLVRGEDDVLKLRGVVPAKASITEGVKTATSRVAEKGLPVLSAVSSSGYVLGAAVQRSGVAAVAVAEVADVDAEGAQRALAILKAALGHVELWLVEQESATTVSAADSGAALALMARALEGRSGRDAAQRAATELAQSLGADRVAIARRRTRCAELLGLSHAADVRRRSDAADLVAAAADEALDQRRALAWPDDSLSAGATRSSLTALARHSGAAGVAAVPMGAPDDPWGALVAEFTFPEDAAAALGPLDIAGAALAPLLEIKRREDRWWPRRIWDAITGACAWLLGPAALGWKMLAVAVLALGVFLASYKSVHRVSAEAVLVSDARVMISAPFDGFLSDRRVRAGDKVSRGEVLLTLDERALTLERLRFEASRAQKKIERDAAVSSRDRTRLSVLSAEIAEIDAELALTDAQLEAGRMRAPFDGVVATDLTTGKIGAPVGRGEELLQIAPERDLSIRLYVPDADIDRVVTGQIGTLRLSAFPDETLPFELTRLTPLTEPREGENAFVVSAQLVGEVAPELTLGMEGIGKIDIERDLWVKSWAVPLMERVRLWLWSVWP